MALGRSSAARADQSFDTAFITPMTINAPVNSPAPDHLALFKTPEEIVDLVGAAGFEVIDTLFSPPSGSTLERARKLNLAISTVIVAKRPEK